MSNLWVYCHRKRARTYYYFGDVNSTRITYFIMSSSDENENISNVDEQDEEDRVSTPNVILTTTNY